LHFASAQALASIAMLFHSLPSRFYVFVSCFQIIEAAQLLTQSTLPQGLSSACTAALLADVGCSPIVASLKAGSFYPNTTLENVCTEGCNSALAGYASSVVSSCGVETWTGYDDEPMPVRIIPDLIRYEYNLSCITDANRFCNNVAAQAAYAADPQGKEDQTLSLFSLTFTQLETPFMETPQVM
jgi:hypothetical protein